MRPSVAVMGFKNLSGRPQSAWLSTALTEMLSTELVRLQCYEGLDEARALYEWNYQKQLLRLQADRRLEPGGSWEAAAKDIFSREYLLERPLLRALRAGPSPEFA